MPVDTRSWEPRTLSDLLGAGDPDPGPPGQPRNDYLGFSATDAFVYAHFPAFDPANPTASITRFLGTLMMLSISSHRDKFPVAVLGRVSPIGYTAGHRTVAGSMGFHLFDYGVVDEMAWHYARQAGYTRPLRLDEFPPFDMTVAFVSEEGAAVQAALRGVTIVDDGYAMQIDDPAPRIVLSYMALDYEPPTQVPYFSTKLQAAEGRPVDLHTGDGVTSFWSDGGSPGDGSPGDGWWYDDDVYPVPDDVAPPIPEVGL